MKKHPSFHKFHLHPTTICVKLIHVARSDNKKQTFGGLTEWLRSSLGMRVRCNSPVGSSPMSSARKSSFSKLLFFLSKTWARTHGVRVLRPCPADCETRTAAAQRRGRTHARAARKAKPLSTSLQRRLSGCGLRPCPPPEKTSQAKPSVRQAACKLIRVSISVN